MVGVSGQACLHTRLVALLHRQAQAVGMHRHIGYHNDTQTYLTLSSRSSSWPLHPPQQPPTHNLSSKLHPPDVMSGWHSAPRREPSFTLPPKRDGSRDVFVPRSIHSTLEYKLASKEVVLHSHDPWSPAWLPPKLI